ncbi:MFS transporter [Salinactinospora qingdaonensis]|uniref:MFS transporter n=1 Tax=Salinactinospora qingdaonensis TaxID=702744 RepID=A0ABP7G0M8_9ACTN
MRSAGHSRFGELWRNGDFLKFWAGETISLFGAQVTLLALPLIAVLVLDSDSGEVGLLRFMQMLPYLLFSLLFGVIADGRRRRPLMIGANAVRAVMLGFVPLLALADLLNLGLLYVITFVVGLGAVMFDVCWLSYVPTLVKERNLLAANGRLGATSSAAEIGGPGLGGILVHLLSAPLALAVNAVSCLVSIASLLLIRAKEVVPPRRPEKRNVMKEAGEGIRWVFSDRKLRVLALLGCCYNFFTTFVDTVFLVYAVRELSLGADEIGIVLGFGGVGGLLGATVANPASRRFGLGKVYGASMLLAFSAWILIPLAGGPYAQILVMVIAAHFLTGFGMGVGNVISISVRQTVTPTALMARMNAAMRMLMHGVAAVGGPVGGYLGGLLGLHTALVIGAVAAILVVLPMLRSRIVRLRDISELSEERAAEATARE